jgi:hypothetical protein
METWKDIYGAGSRKGVPQLMKHVFRTGNQINGFFFFFSQTQSMLEIQRESNSGESQYYDATSICSLRS